MKKAQLFNVLKFKYDSSQLGVCLFMTNFAQ